MPFHGLLSLLTLVCLSTVSATKQVDIGSGDAGSGDSSTKQTDDGLTGAAIAGIIAGICLGLIFIGCGVYIYTQRVQEVKNTGSGTMSYAASAGSNERRLPMVALRVSGNDDV